MCAVPPFSTNRQAAKAQASKLPLSPSKQSIGILHSLLSLTASLISQALRVYTRPMTLGRDAKRYTRADRTTKGAAEKKRNDPLNGLRCTGCSPTSRSFIKHRICKMQSVVHARFSSFIAPLVLSLHFRG